MTQQEQTAQQLFGAVLDLPAEQRSTFLDSACRDLPELRQLVDELLLENERAAGFLSNSAFIPADDSVPDMTFAPIRLAAGTTLGRYSIIEPLGAGGMGVVYLARDGRLERNIAIKILAPGVLIDGEARRRFHKEALTLAKLSHPHIATLYDVGQQDGVDYIVMECVAGESLSAKLKSGPLTMMSATSIVLQIAEALEEAHERGVVHRDLKPANVMVTPKGQVKVLDFGIAKLLAPVGSDATETFPETRGLLGTPLYMSPEQVRQEVVDARTDLWSLGVLYYESLTGCVPFKRGSNIATLRAIVEENPLRLSQLRTDTPQLAERITSRALEKETASRYQTASEVIGDATNLLAELTTSPHAHEKPTRRAWRMAAVISILSVLLLTAAGFWIYRSSKRQWAREQVPQIAKLLDAHKSLAAMELLERAQRYLPADPTLKKIAGENTKRISVTSSPSAAKVQIQDYVSPDAPWHTIGVTPLRNIRVPNGYFRWRVSKEGDGELISAPLTNSKMEFDLDASRKSPKGMVLTPGGYWLGLVGFIGWIGPYKLPPYYVGRYEITNREYQSFVDSGGYRNKHYWPAQFIENGRKVEWNDAMAKFRDATGRPGPSTWVAGHYPEGKADYPVSGVSWFEASAYAAFAGKSLPVVAQWFQNAPEEVSGLTVQTSNIGTGALAPVGAYKGVGPYGTYDMVGNVREWVVNSADQGLRFILGGSWQSPSYLSYIPGVLSPFDRSKTNGFRCVQNLGPMQAEAEKPLIRTGLRNFSHYKPASNSVFHAYELLYRYPKTPLNATVNGIVKETADWREERVTFDTGYRGERMSAYLFLPKKVRPPYQTVLFFPSANIDSIPDNKGGRELGDLHFFDYIVQSGRAVMYPIYENTYERHVKFQLPDGAQNIQLTIDWYKDAARSLDYLATRRDIDSSKLAFLGDSVGSVEGIIISTLEQERLKTAILLDGGYFLDKPTPGEDEADFAPRMKKPVLMVNGRYDFSFPVKEAQDPLFAMLGTPNADKRHVILNAAHGVNAERPQMIRTVLDWLDHYLGRVND